MAEPISLEYLERLNPCRQFDENIRFFDYYDDPTTGQQREHVYLIGNPENVANSCTPASEVYDFSVTTMVHSFFPHFNPNETAGRIVRGRRWQSDPGYKYYHMPEEEIKAQWKLAGQQASTLGTAMHLLVETFYNHPSMWSVSVRADLERMMRQHFSSEQLSAPEIGQFVDFHLSGPVPWKWKPWRTELRVFDRELKVAGSVDMLYESPDFSPERPNLIMIDWKRSREISYTTQYGQYARPPVAHLQDCNYAKYSLQLNVYKHVIEAHTPYRIVYMALGVFHPEASGFQVHPVPVMAAEVTAILEDRLRKVKYQRNQRDQRNQR